MLVSKPELLIIPYFYFVGGVVLVLIPVISVLFKFPNLIVKFSKMGAYFFYSSIIYEITALKLGLWDFPGDQFIGWVSIFGTVFPFEELFFWIILGVLSVLSYYEFFDDDRK